MTMTYLQYTSCVRQKNDKATAPNKACLDLPSIQADKIRHILTCASGIFIPPFVNGQGMKNSPLAIRKCKDTNYVDVLIIHIRHLVIR